MNPFPRTTSRKKQPGPRGAVGMPWASRQAGGASMVLKLRAHQRLGVKPALSWLQLRDKFFEFVRPAAARPAPLPARLALSRGVRVRGGGMRAPRACGRPTAPAWRARACSSPGGRRVPRAGIRGARGPTDLGAPAQINLVGLLGQGLAFMLRSPPPFSPRARARARACASPAPVGDAS